MVLENWTSSLREITQIVSREFGSLSPQQLNWKPNPNTWSIAQNLHHLVVVNETYYPVLDSLNAGSYRAPFKAKLGFMVSFLGKSVLKAVQPDRQKKMKTFPIWEPSSGIVIDDVLNKFQMHQAELIRRIESSKALLEKGVVISSPAKRQIVYKLETAFDIIVAHEKRHFEQSKEILELIKANNIC